jgi:hypothetical protein
MWMDRQYFVKDRYDSQILYHAMDITRLDEDAYETVRQTATQFVIKQRISKKSHSLLESRIESLVTSPPYGEWFRNACGVSPSRVAVTWQRSLFPSRRSSRHRRESIGAAGRLIRLSSGRHYLDCNWLESLLKDVRLI